MEEIKKKTPEEEEQKKSETPPEEKPQEEPEKDKPEENKPAPNDKQSDENGEGADKAEDKSEPDKPPEKEEPKEEVPSENVPDPKDEEILRLKTQIAAMNLGIKPECVEDAVAIAESYVKSGRAKDTQAALSEVVKKYPDMKGGKDDKSKGGFKVGAGSSDKEEKPQDKPTVQKRWNKFK